MQKVHEICMNLIPFWAITYKRTLPNSLFFPMDAAKPNQKALLPMVDTLVLDRKTKLKAAVEKVTAQYDV